MSECGGEQYKDAWYDVCNTTPERRYAARKTHRLRLISTDSVIYASQPQPSAGLPAPSPSLHNGFPGTTILEQFSVDMSSTCQTFYANCEDQEAVFHHKRIRSFDERCLNQKKPQRGPPQYVKLCKKFLMAKSRRTATSPCSLAVQIVLDK